MNAPGFDHQKTSSTRRTALRVLLGGSAAAVAALAVGCGGAPAGGASGGSAAESRGGSKSGGAANAAGTQTNEGGQVTVKVTWQGRPAGAVFEVAMDTHAVDLDGYDLRRLATLRTSGASGRREAQPTEWKAPKGGHHVDGVLRFPVTAADGAPLIDASTRTVELVIRDVAGVAERKFLWVA